MGMYTNFYGEITLKDEKVIRYLKYQLKLEYDDVDFPFVAISGEKIEGNKLIINSYERNYDEDVETALAMLIRLDPKATGEVLSTYEDGTIEEDPRVRERFVLRNGKVFKSVLKEVKCIYGVETEFSPDFDEDAIKDIHKNIHRCQSLDVCEICKETIVLEDFDFSKRKYYDAIKEKTEIKNLCKKCYMKKKKPYVEEEKIKKEYEDKLIKIEEKK